MKYKDITHLNSLLSFSHESASGFYRVSVYFIAKVFCDLLPLRAVPAILYALVTYWMMGKY